MRRLVGHDLVIEKPAKVNTKLHQKDPTCECRFPIEKRVMKTMGGQIMMESV